VTLRIDSIGAGYGRELKKTNFLGIGATRMELRRDGPSTSAVPKEVERPATVPMDRPLNVDSIFHATSSSRALAYLNQAVNKAKRVQSEYKFKGTTIEDDRRVIRRHAIELQKKFTLSFACIIFFFIGAPLGAIIRKGGLGTPLVISVLLFIFYYIIDNTGYKMARDGKVAVWEGMWLSAAVLLPMGVFLTYKAVKDSAVFNADAYRAFFRSLLGLREQRNVTLKEVRINDVDPAEARRRLADLAAEARSLASGIASRRSYPAYWRGRIVPHAALSALRTEVEATIEYLSDTARRDVIALLNRFPVIAWRWIYDPSDGRRVLSWLGMILFPVGVPLYVAGLLDYRRLRRELEAVASAADDLARLPGTPS